MQRTRPELRAFARRLIYLVAAIVGLLALGTAGYAVTEDRGVWFSFQWALDTVATIGSFPRSRTLGGQLVHVGLIVLGVGTLFYALVTVTEFFVAGHLGDLLQERRRQKMIDRLSDHYIVCGYGRVGRQVARDLRAAGVRYVVIDPDPENVAAAQGHIGVRAMEGTPSADDTLRQAGIDRARAIIACVDSDAENIFVTLTARELNPEIAIVARASVEDSENKLRRAGADRVISPYKSSGAEMARLALHPQVTGVADVGSDYRVEEISVEAGCEGAGQMLGDVRGGSIIIGLRREGGFQPQPAGETIVQHGDVLVAMGTPRTMERLERLFARGPATIVP